MAIRPTDLSNSRESLTISLGKKKKYEEINFTQAIAEKLTIRPEKKMKYEVINFWQDNEITNFSQESFAPAELMGEICKNLPLESVGRIASVCRTWQMIMDSNHVWTQFRLPTLFPKLKCIGFAEWDRYVNLKEHGLDPTGTPQINDRNKVRRIKHLIDTAQIEGNAGFTHLTLPKGLTFCKLMEIAQTPKEGTSTQVVIVFQRILQRLNDGPIPETRQLLISNNILSESKGRSFFDLEVLASQHGCQMPGVLAATTLAILTKMMTDVRLFDHGSKDQENPWPYTLCVELAKGYPLVAGNYTAADRLYVTYADVARSSDGVSRVGVGVQMEL